MPLVDIEIPQEYSALPSEFVEFLGEADVRINQFMLHKKVRSGGFVPSDFRTVYQALRTISEANLAPGTTMCEWGSGFGVISSMASMLNFTAYGIEIEQDLVSASQRLADDFGLPVEFVQGSFIPWGGEALAEEAYVDNNAEYSWLIKDAAPGYDDLQLEPSDFDVIFCYPWPGEEYLITTLFEKFAAEGAVLLTYNDLDTVRLRRKQSDQSNADSDTVGAPTTDSR